jgi:hypothetical protein
VQVAIQSKTDRQNVLKIEKNHNYAMVRTYRAAGDGAERAWQDITVAGVYEFLYTDAESIRSTGWKTEAGG